MLSGDMLKSLNRQINRELYSAYFYLGMASYAASKNLKGFANWFNVQVREEASHAQRLYDYVVGQDGRVMLEAIEEPPQDFKSAEDLFKRTLDHEKKVTGMINNLVALSMKEKDKTTEEVLQWFVKEQREEEESAERNLRLVRDAGSDRVKILNVDNQLAKRK